MSAPVLTVEQLEVRREIMLRMHRDQLCASHEALRAERDGLIAEHRFLNDLKNERTAERDAALAVLAAVVRKMLPLVSGWTGLPRDYAKQFEEARAEAEAALEDAAGALEGGSRG